MAHRETTFLVEPLDTVWIRGGKPFLAGEDSADQAAFPPSPWTWQGLVRTRVLRAALAGDLRVAPRDQVERLIGPPDTLPPSWRLTGPFPAARKAEGLEPWVPMPALLMQAEHPTQGEEVDVPIAPMPAEATAGLLCSPWPGAGRWPTVEDAADKQKRRGWISASNLDWLLTGEGRWDPRGVTARELPPFVALEPRPGVQINATTGTAEDHMLYVAEHLRFQAGCGLLGGLSGPMDARIPPDALVSGAGSLGYKSRLVSFHAATPSARWEALLAGRHLPARGPLPDPVGVWVVLLTPAEANGPGLPFALPSTCSVQLELDLGRVGPSIGGFDRVAGGGRAARATYAAGSAWLFRLSGGSPAQRLDAARALQGLPPHAPTERERLGFGQRLAALCDLDTWRPLAPQGA